MAITIPQARSAATAAAAERLLNTFFRETGQPAPILAADDRRLLVLPAPILEELQAQGHPFCLELPATRTRIYGAVTYASLFGHHRYGHRFWRQTEDATLQAADGAQLAEPLLTEVGQRDADSESRSRRVADLVAQVQNSIEKTTRFVEHHAEHGAKLWELTGGERTKRAESGLVFGHPFHPTPKSSEGFSAADLELYAPELHASFTLCYFAAAPELVQEAWVEGTGIDPFPPALLAEAQQKLATDRQQYQLLPCHPWQAKHLLTWPEVQELIQSGQLVYLGPLGVPVHPTSSVRTVWSPELAAYLKLPLNVRITNFIRVNPLDQLERTLDAATYTESLRPLPYEGLTILAEAGYRTLVADQLPEAARLKLIESFAVIFRQNPVLAEHADDETPVVVASLLETRPGEATAPLYRFVEQAAQARGAALDADFVKAWLQQYVAISLLPLLDLFFRHGYSAEAHVQNSMVTLDHGWPARFYVRDLEGVSVSRAVAGDVLATGSVALYDDEQAWHRFKYYILVNHTGHLLHALAHDTGVSEQELWDVVGAAIQGHEGFASERARRGVRDLFTTPHFAAKANLISRFQERGETPHYVEIPNPLFQKREVTQ
ncbi:siderophore synthetase component [Tumebacillus sp. BK434]|uniref:IucA/IucC family protein n=1 Tax=Tumebacillus sp. BK434 TaxID=2512169 RepID=UPI001051BBFB|nr:IucA/IucC family protein [Tumebacillus sp. BK434]TCP55760.1 siderophore synthetase component [Tumebacillus sp. BK434]